jgi:hypothetical protein
MAIFLSLGALIGKASESQKHPNDNGYKCEYLKAVGKGFAICQKIKE